MYSVQTLFRKLERFVQRRFLRPAVSILDRALDRTVFSHDRALFRKLTHAVRSLRCVLLFMDRGARLAVFTLEGRDAEGEERSILYCGEREAMTWFGSLLLPGGHRETPHGFMRPWQMRTVLENASREQDLVALEVNRCLSPRLPGRPFYAIPRWVRVRIPVLPSWGEQRSIMTKSGRKQLKSIRRRGFQCEISHDPAEFVEFHDRMYLPFVKTRHGENVIYHDRKELERFFRKGSILKIVREGRWEAGTLNVVAGSEIRMLVLGVRDCDPALLRDNVVKAAYYYTIDEAMKQGLTSVEVGRVRPLYEDKVLHAKLRWGGTIFRDPWEEARILVYPGKRISPFTSLPRLHPFLEEAGDGLRGHVVLPDPLPKESQARENALRSYASAGLASVDITGSNGSHVAASLP